MRVVNRTAVTITGAQPFIDWMRETDADFNQGARHRRRAPKPTARRFSCPSSTSRKTAGMGRGQCGVAVRLPAVGLDRERKTAWPAEPRLKTFREWFRIDIHSVVVDVADDDIEGEEL